MRPVTVSCVVDTPRERVFDYLADIANQVEFTDHFVRDFHLERVESRGVGAAARFRLRFPLRSTWVELVVAELDRPYRVVLEGAAGRIGRVPVRVEYRLTRYDTDMTCLELAVSSAPTAPIDRIREGVGARAWLRRQCSRALWRLRTVLEQGEPSSNAAGVAAG
jgi:uncharacterized protein YndB with AHSA1/START domain